MSYFDSPKNRAIWERELKILRQEREDRATNGYRPREPDSQKEISREEANPFRRRISLKELEQREAEQRGRAAGPRERAYGKAAARSPDKTPPSMGQKEPTL